MRLTALLPVVAAAALAGAVGYGVGLVTAPQSEPVEVAPSRTAAADDARPRADDPEDDGTQTRRDERRKRRPKTVSLSAALPSVSVPGLATGDGAVTGTVKTPDGEAVTEVTVVLTPSVPANLQPDGRPEHEIPPEELIESYARRLLYARNNRQEVFTDEEGGFVAERLNADARYAVTARKDGFRIVPNDPGAAARASIGQVIEFVARPTSTVEFELQLPDGRTPERATIHARMGRQNHRFTWSAAKPDVELEPGTYDVWAVAGADQEFKSKSRSMEITADGFDAPQELVLTGRPGIHGTLVFEEPEGMQHVYVWAARIDAGTEMDKTQLRNVGTRTTAAAARGFSFKFQDLSPGTYAVGAGRSSRGPIEAIENVRVGDGPTEHTLTVPKLDPTRYLTLIAIDGEGARVDVRSVSLSYRGQRRNRSRNAQVMKLPDGTVRVMHQSVPSNVKDARMYLTATSPTHGTTQVEYRTDTVTEVRVEFATPATLAVSVEGHEETRYADSVRVGLYRVQQEGNSTRTASAGSFSFKGTTEHTFTGLQPGSYHLYLYAGTRRAVVVDHRTFDVGTGTNSVALQVPQLSRVTVRGAHRYVRARRTSQGYRVQVNGVAGEGHFVVDLLPPGTYEFRDGRNRRQTIALPGTSEVQF